MRAGKNPPLFPSHYLPMALIFVLLLGVNSFLISPYISWYDSGELIGTTVCLGISHPSGQALFHLLGKCFLLWPWGTPAFKVELMSVFCAALASALFFDLCRRLVARLMPPDLLRRDLSFPFKVWLFLLTLGWSWSLPWWRYSLMPLVYALHLLMAMLILWALSLEKPWKWQLAFLILGASSVLRPTQLFVMPFLGLAFLLAHRKQARLLPKIILQCMFCFLVGRSVGLYLPLRSALHPEMAYGDVTHFHELFRHIFALRFSKYVGTVTLANIFLVFRQMVSHFFTDLTPFGAGLAVWGAGFLWWEREKIPTFIWVGMAWGLTEALFVFTIPYPTFESHQVLLGWAFSGFLAAMPMAMADQTIRKGQYKTLLRSFYLVLVVFVLAQLSMMPHLLERKADRSAQDYARNVLTLMAPHALYLPYEENEYFPVAGFQESFNFRKDIELVEPGTSKEIMGKKVEECLTQGRPIYVTHQWDLPAKWTLQSMGPIWRVVLKTPLQGQKATMTQAQAAWGNIRLLSATVEPAQVEAGGMVQVTYHWQRVGPGPCDQTESVVSIFTDEKGNYSTRDGIFWLHDIHEPFGTNFSALKPGLEYVERRIVMIPSDYPTGKYQLSVGLQKKVKKKNGEENFDKEFYERAAAQTLDKFQGRGDHGVLVQFSTASPTEANSLWPVGQSLLPALDGRFVPAASLQIVSPQ